MKKVLICTLLFLHILQITSCDLDSTDCSFNIYNHTLSNLRLIVSSEVDSYLFLYPNTNVSFNTEILRNNSILEISEFSYQINIIDSDNNSFITFSETLFYDQLSSVIEIHIINVDDILEIYSVHE